MPTGKRCCRTGGAPANAPHGFSYLLLLWSLAIAAAGATGAALSHQTAAQRERERELLFRGQQIVLAIERYRNAAQPPTWPASLEDLLEDNRFRPPQRHLRRHWADPFTGQPDWRLLKAFDGGIVGVQSRSLRPALAQRDTPPAPRLSSEPARVGHWRFVARGGLPSEGHQP
jgi:type II secretory pathway pseudopilin PulG